MKPSRVVMPLLLLGAVIVVTVNAGLAFRALETLDENGRWVEHTWQVIAALERVMGSIASAESGARGFLIVNDPAYLEPYKVALGELPGEMDAFRTLTADNPRQQARAQEMETIIAARLQLLAQRIEARRTGASDLQTLRQNSTGVGRSQMVHLREVANSAEAEEQGLLAFRRDEVRKSGRRARLTLLLASLLDLLLIVLIFRYLLRERAMRLESVETARVLAQSRLDVERKANEIQALNVTLEERVRQRTAELEATNAELEAFSYSVSHDLRAPLRTIDGFSLALEEDYAAAVDAVGRDYIRRTRAGVQRMGQLIDALLQLSRITRAEIIRERFSLSELARIVAEDIRQENAGRTLDITVEDGLMVEADPKLLRVALENLFGNAAKFTGKVAHPAMHFGWNPAQAAFFIRDNGAGFDMYYADKLFNAFNRLHGDKDFTGSGIGLATVARVVRRHHGRIWAESAVDRGATFFFTVGLPNG